MEVGSWEISSNGTVDSEVDSQGTSDEEHSHVYDKIPKLQMRKVVSKARWDAEMGMAEIIEIKGGMWTTMGIIRKSKIYCSVEETMFLIRLGALSLYVNDTSLSLGDFLMVAAKEKNRSSWVLCEAYRILKTLGYVVGRYGVPWTKKNAKTCSSSINLKDVQENNGIPDNEVENISISDLFRDMQINDVKPVFDVYLPNRKFRKSSPGNPYFVLCLTRGYPPSKADIENLEKMSTFAPIKLCYVEHEHVNFFSFNRTELPILP